MQIAPRRRLTPKVLGYLLCDVVGMVLFAMGALWLLRGLPLFSRSFPSTNAEAAAALVGGLLLMIFSITRLLREMIVHAGNDNSGRPPR